MSAATRCQPQTLAHNGNLRVDLCACGQVHVTLGAVTIRLDREHYLRLCDTLLAAARLLPREAGARLH